MLASGGTNQGTDEGVALNQCPNHASADEATRPRDQYSAALKRQQGCPLAMRSQEMFAGQCPALLRRFGNGRNCAPTPALDLRWRHAVARTCAAAQLSP